MTEPRPHVLVPDLREGQAVDYVYECTEKKRSRGSRGHQPTLRAAFTDRSRARIEGRAFENLDELDERCVVRELVRVVGRVEEYEGRLRIKIADLGIVDPETVNPALYLPASHRDPKEFVGLLQNLRLEIEDEDFAAAVGLFYDDEKFIGKDVEDLDSDPFGTFRGAFRMAPCSVQGHHAFLGGALEHTFEVARPVPELCLPRKEHLNVGLLLAAALLHLVGKTRCFRYGVRFSLSEEGTHKPHWMLGAEMVRERIRAKLPDFPRHKLRALEYCLLAQEGLEHMPSDRFKYTEAHVLHNLTTAESGLQLTIEHGRTAFDATPADR